MILEMFWNIEKQSHLNNVLHEMNTLHEDCYIILPKDGSQSECWCTFHSKDGSKREFYCTFLSKDGIKSESYCTFLSKDWQQKGML